MATTILWAGSEDLDFSTIGNVAYSQAAGTFDPTVSRGAMELPVNTGGGVNSIAIGNNVAFTASSSMWFHGAFYSSPDIGGSSQTGMAFTDASGVQRFQVQFQYTGTTTFYTISLAKQDGAGRLISLVSGLNTIAVNNLSTVDVFINMASGNGSFAFYQNKTLLTGFSGNTLTDNQMTLTNILLNGPAWNTGGTGNYWSQCIVANSDTRSMKMATVYPSGVGNTQTWSVNSASSAWQAVNPWIVSDIGNIAVSTTSQLAEFTISNLVSGAYSIPAIITSIRALAGSSGPQSIAHVVRVGSTDYSGASQTLLQSVNNTQQVWGANPNTGSRWQVSDITNPLFNIGVVSEPPVD